MLAKKVPLHNLSDDDQLLTPTYGQRSLDKALPRFEVPEDGMSPQTAYNVIRDELMLDGNARLNLATFVTTWMEPEARQLMIETFDKSHCSTANAALALMLSHDYAFFAKRWCNQLLITRGCFCRKVVN